jgi:hypothetical protein
MNGHQNIAFWTNAVSHLHREKKAVKNPVKNLKRLINRLTFPTLKLKPHLKLFALRLFNFK